jgi:hypothetical protein
MVVIEDVDGRIEHAVELFVQPGHDQGADFLVVDTSDQGVLQGMAEGAMAYIVKQNGHASAPVLVFGDHNAFLAKGVQCLLHQVQSAQCMMESVVHGTGVNQVTHAKLTDSAEPLNPRVVHDFREVGVSELDEPIHRVI